MKLGKKLFITFEGPEGAGKTTQVILLKKFLEEKFEIVEKERVNQNKLYLSAFIASLLRTAKIEKIREIPGIDGKVNWEIDFYASKEN